MMATITGVMESAIPMSRPIDRLAPRCLSNEPKEVMNCKSCRKRKIKCNRVRPSCEACQVFNVSCVYDAIPKKRGPKTDVLEALLKRVNGLEKRLKDEDKPVTTNESNEETAGEDRNSSTENAPQLPVVEEALSEPLIPQTTALQTQLSLPPPPHLHLAPPSHQHEPQPRPQPRSQQSIPLPPQPVDTSRIELAPIAPSLPSQIPFAPPVNDPCHRSSVPPYNGALLDVYFNRLHGKPYFILDETATRQRWQAGQLPVTIISSIEAVTARYATHLLGGYNIAISMSKKNAAKARAALDSDEPTVENLQASLLLTNTYFQSGRGKKCYMLLSSAISMALALGLHRELPAHLPISPAEREGRRRLFWTCYLMDRFTAAGSKRPCSIADDSICLRLPAWSGDADGYTYESSYFSSGANANYGSGGRTSLNIGASLVEIVRILGSTDRYLAAGGVKGDSHFPWHSQSSLSILRQDLDTWANQNQYAFTSTESMSRPGDHKMLVLAKLIYHVVHCLIYRPFLPIDLAELIGTGQHQSWQIESTNLCFFHANAIAELVGIGRISSVDDWPAFVGYCLCTAGTVHVHGAHYMAREGDMFARSAEYLSREMTMLSDMRMAWAGLQHQREILQTVYECHSQLVQSLASNPMRFSSAFQMDDFFDRYPTVYIDGSFVTLSDVSVETIHESLFAYDESDNSAWKLSQEPVPDHQVLIPSPAFQVPQLKSDTRPVKRRRRTVDLQHQSSGKALKFATQAYQNPVDAQSGSAAAAAPGLSTPTIAEGVGPSFQSLAPGPLSPSFSLSPWSMALSLDVNNMPQSYGQAPNNANANPSDNFSFGAMDQQTPGGYSADGSALSETDKDPFLSLLEQLAENEHLQREGPSDLDFYLGGQD